MYFNYVLNTKVIQHEPRRGALKSIRWHFYNRVGIARHTKSFIQTKVYKKKRKKKQTKESHFFVHFANRTISRNKLPHHTPQRSYMYVCIYVNLKMHFVFFLLSFNILHVPIHIIYTHSAQRKYPHEYHTYDRSHLPLFYGVQCIYTSSAC